MRETNRRGLNRSEIRIDAKKFQESITEELKTVKDRVRNLIGDANWGEEGRYKEAILRNVIRRFLPSNLSIGTGFIVKESNDGIKVSSQIDIIIYDNTIPVLFSEGDFIIITDRNVKGIIEVKTKISSSNLQSTIEKATKNGKLLEKDNKNEKSIKEKIFNGIFSYEYEGNLDNIEQHLENPLKQSKGYVNHLALGENIFVKYWGEDVFFPDISYHKHYNIYKLKNLSFSYFISNLLYMVCNRTLNDRIWFLFPKDKEGNRIGIIPVD